MQILLAILIIPSFALVGISGYQSFGDDANTVAKIDGQALTQQEWDAAQRNQLENFRQRMGPQFDQKLFDTPEFKNNVLENLIAERAISAEVKRAHLSVSDATLQKTILDTPGLTGDDGKFDYDRYRKLLTAQGLSEQGYEADQRRRMAMGQLAESVEATGFAPRTVSKLLSDFSAQEREVQELVLPAAQYLSQVKVTDEMVKAFYDKNSKFFEVPEQAKIEYVVFNAAAVAASVTATDDEVANFYKQNEKRFTTPETRRASHILVALKPGAGAADKNAAKAKAEAILADVRKNPADFAKIAKAKSEDPVSAEVGGDLNVIEKGSLVKPVEDAIFQLKQGEISNVVESEFGFHVLTVTQLKPASVKPLDETKAEVVAEVKKQKAAKQYSEMAETFTNTVYEQADSLKPVADKLGLKIETAEHLSREPSPMLGTAPFNNAKFLKALFNDEALKNKRNTEAVEVAPSTLIAGRIVEHKPASKRPLAEVDAQIRQRVTIEEAAKLARKAGEEKLAAVKKSNDVAGFSEARLISRAKADSVPPQAAAALMKADTSKLPAYIGVEVPGQGYGVYRINKVQQPTQQDDARRKMEAERISQAQSQQEMFDFIEALKRKAKAKVLHTSSAAKPDAVK
ncbi:SurA N-terminal domain-containing protein [Massilia sp. MB5]|uniref:SurA N-terminal domain-containing protein n=1 Tax=Massilia sp. MB5 TaxID=2919578 RepID=UPI001F0D6D8E|nr:SurA N-terminal domain-containing protein [Massilia sp. MB5]UMR29292.1 SurA N-terminal domain-containing protein [Massilia sp. MB5]